MPVLGAAATASASDSASEVLHVTMMKGSMGLSTSWLLWTRHPASGTELSPRRTHRVGTPDSSPTCLWADAVVAETRG